MDTILCFSEPLRFFTAFFFDEAAILISRESSRSHLKNASEAPWRRCESAQNAHITTVYAALFHRPAPCPEP
jgi:hypothetical protein